MPNSNRPFGLAAFKSEGKENRVTQYAKATSAAIYEGDAVMMNSSGQVVTYVAGAGNQLLGVASEYVAAAGTSIGVYDDPNSVFLAQVSADFQNTDAGLNCDLVATTGDTVLLGSKHAALSTFAATANLPLRVLGLAAFGENEVGSYAVVKVRPNNHAYKVGASGV